MRRVLLLLLLLTAFGVAVAGCGGGDDETATPETVEGTLSQPAEVEGDATAGKAVFASAGCGGCHTLADANASGNVGPNLDDAKPSTELVTERVTNGKGAMPSFRGQLTEQQIADVAAYVSSTAGS
jgi:mono/diheme cytochrome c family protein